MKVIFAQGNPSGDYDGTRHNVGFMVLDELAKSYGVSFVNKPKFKAHIAEINTDQNRILLVKPTTFYNQSGVAAQHLIAFYKLNPSQDLLLIHDDLALPFGTIRIRSNGSDAGNNGIKSLNAHIGPDYGRIRIGIHTEGRDHIDDAAFVLAQFSADEQTALRDKLIPKAIELSRTFLAGGLTDTSHVLL